MIPTVIMAHPLDSGVSTATHINLQPVSQWVPLHRNPHLDHQDRRGITDFSRVSIKLPHSLKPIKQRYMFKQL